MQKNKISKEIMDKLFISDIDKFLKCAKKLQKNLKIEEIDIKLSKAQEMLAKSLGFRDLNELEKNLKNDNNSAEVLLSETEKNNVMFEDNMEKMLMNLTPNTLSNILLRNEDEDEDGDGFWGQRALVVVNLVAEIFYNVNSINKMKNLDLFSELLMLDNIITIYTVLKNNLDKDKIDVLLNNKSMLSLNVNVEMMKNIEMYLKFLPGFQVRKPKQSEIVYEQHGYLQMQVIKGINDLKVINKDICIYDEKWSLSQKFLDNGYYVEMVTSLYADITKHKKSFFINTKQVRLQ